MVAKPEGPVDRHQTGMGVPGGHAGAQEQPGDAGVEAGGVLGLRRVVERLPEAGHALLPPAVEHLDEAIQGVARHLRRAPQLASPGAEHGHVVAEALQVPNSSASMAANTRAVWWLWGCPISSANASAALRARAAPSGCPRNHSVLPRRLVQTTLGSSPKWATCVGGGPPARGGATRPDCLPADLPGTARRPPAARPRRRRRRRRRGRGRPGRRPRPARTAPQGASAAPAGSPRGTGRAREGPGGGCAGHGEDSCAPAARSSRATAGTPGACGAAAHPCGAAGGRAATPPAPTPAAAAAMRPGAGPAPPGAGCARATMASSAATRARCSHPPPPRCLVRHSMPQVGGDSDALPTEAGPPNRISALAPQVVRKRRTPLVASWRKIDWISSAE